MCDDGSEQVLFVQALHHSQDANYSILLYTCYALTNVAQKSSGPANPVSAVVQKLCEAVLKGRSKY